MDAAENYRAGGTVSGIVDTLSLLAKTDALRFAPGALVVVRDRHQVYEFRVNSTQPVDHDGVEIALNYPGAQWVRTTSSSNAAATVAGWPLGPTTPRFYALDGANGLDTNPGYSDVSAALAGAVAVKTPAGLGNVIPKYGAGRTLEIIIAAGTYTGGLDAFLQGIQGYKILIRGTVTNTTAGSVAFADDANDATMCGAVTATGCNAAGYNPTGSPTTTVIQLMKVGGAAAALPVEPAMPLMCRMRFDVNTATVALRNVCRTVMKVTGTDTINAELNSALPAVPAGGDVLYLEMGGVVVGNTIIGTAPEWPTSQTVIVGVRMGTCTARDSRVQFTLCGGSSLTTAANRLLEFRTSYTHRSLGSKTVGGGFRSEGSWLSRTDILGTVTNVATVTSISIADMVDVTSFNGVVTGTNCLLQGGTASVAALGGSNTQDGLRTIAGNLQLFTTRVTLGKLNLNGAAAGITVFGTCDIVFSGQPVCLASGLTDCGMDLSASVNSRIFIANPVNFYPITGANGDIRFSAMPLFSGGGPYAPWNQLQFTGLGGYKDTMGNIICGGIGGDTLHTYAPQIGRVTAVAVGGVDIAQFSVVTISGIPQGATLAEADTAGHASGQLAILITPGKAGNYALAALEAIVPVLSEDVGVIGDLAYLSTATAGKVQHAVPAVAGTNQKRRVGYWCNQTSMISFLNLDAVPVTADGLA